MVLPIQDPVSSLLRYNGVLVEIVDYAKPNVAAPDPVQFCCPSPDADIFMELPSLEMVALVYLKLFISSVCMLLMLISCFAIARDHEFTSVSAGIPYTFELLVC